MKWLSCVTVAAGVVLLSGTMAVANMTAMATWNSGPASDAAWQAGSYPAWAAEPGFDWILYRDGPQDAVSGWPFIYPLKFPDSDGEGKFTVRLGECEWGPGGALKDDPEDGAMYVALNDGHAPDDPLRTLVDEQGTIAFWFKPMWDPAVETARHSLLMVNLSSANRDGLFIRYNGDGTVTTQFKTQSLNNGGPDIDIGHDWTSNALIDDWNHVAFTWDRDGLYTYANGNKVGETIYSPPRPPKVDWADTMYAEFGQEGQSSTDYQSNALWDSMGVWNEVLYTGDSYSPPTDEVDGGILGPPDDCFIGQADLDIVLGCWGMSPPCDPRADHNGDGFVGQEDLDFVLSAWGDGTPPPSAPEPATLAIFALCGLALLRRKGKSR